MKDVNFFFRNVLPLRVVSGDFLFVIDNELSIDMYGLMNMALRFEANSKDNDPRLENVRRDTRLRYDEYGRRNRFFSPFALKIVNFSKIYFIFDSLDMDYFISGRRFKFVKSIEFRFPSESIKLSHYITSLEKICSLSQSSGDILKNLKKITVSFGSNYWIDNHFGFLRYFENFRFSSFQISSLKHEPSQYDSKFRQEPEELLKFLTKKSEITRLEFGYASLIGNGWAMFFQRPPSHIKELQIPLQDSLDHLKMLKFADNMRENKPGNLIFLRSLSEHPEFGMWETMFNSHFSFKRIRSLTVDDGELFPGKLTFQDSRIKRKYQLTQKALISSKTLKEYYNFGREYVSNINVSRLLRFYRKLKRLKIGTLHFTTEELMEKVLNFFEVNYPRFKEIKIKTIDLEKFPGGKSSEYTKFNIRYRKRSIRFFRNIGMRDREIRKLFKRITYMTEDNGLREQLGNDIHYQRRCELCRRSEKEKNKNGKSKRLMFCSRCMRVFYCSRKCQTEDWKKHKKSCNIINKR